MRQIYLCKKVNTLTKGSHTFEGVTEGKYSYNVFFAGYETVSGEFNVTAATTTIDVILKEIIVAPFSLNSDGIQYYKYYHNDIESSENFENVEDFSMLIPNWKILDVDQKPAFGVSTCDFPNENEPSAGLVFNPKTTAPAVDGDMLMKAHSGDKYWMFRSAAEETNDWLWHPFLLLRILV